MSTVYCQLGRSVPVVNARRHHVSTQTIIAQVRGVLAAHEPGEFDWITFVGSGEPTLHAGLGEMIRAVKAMTLIPVAVITNGSLFYLPEVMLVRGLNDSEQALRSIAEALRRVDPDEVHLNLPTRPPAETWVEPAATEGIIRARAILGEIARVARPSSGRFDLSGYTDVVDAVVGIVTRHPMREEELIDALARPNRYSDEPGALGLVLHRRQCRARPGARGYRGRLGLPIHRHLSPTPKSTVSTSSQPA